jgi:hypothetical protein
MLFILAQAWSRLMQCTVVFAFMPVHQFTLLACFAVSHNNKSAQLKQSNVFV